MLSRTSILPPSHVSLCLPARLSAVLLAVCLSGFSVRDARATVAGFASVWDPTNVANGFQLVANDPSGSASMSLTPDNQILTVSMALSACYTACGAFTFGSSGVLGNLPYGLVQFDWSLINTDFTEDGQINISGADSTTSSPGSWLFPNTTYEGTALIDYEGGSLSLFDITFGGYDTGTASATITLFNFTAPDSVALDLASQPSAVLEPAGGLCMLVAFGALTGLRRRRVAGPA